MKLSTYVFSSPQPLTNIQRLKAGKRLEEKTKIMSHAFTSQQCLEVHVLTVHFKVACYCCHQT